MRKEFTYYVNREDLRGDGLSENAIAVLIAIAVNSYGKNEQFISYSYLEYVTLGKDFSCFSKNYRKNIIQGFNELVEKDFVVITKKMKDNGYICDISNINTRNKSKKCVLISKAEFCSIMKLNEGVDNFKLLKYFLDLIETLNESVKLEKEFRFKIGALPLEQIALITNTSRPTVVKYNSILEKNNLIYIVRRRASVTENVSTGKVYKQLPSVYGRYEDRQKCDDYIKRHGFKKKDKEYINFACEMRSLAQRYNVFVAKYKDERCDDIIKVKRAYEAAKQWNQYAVERYNDEIADGKNPEVPKYKDLSIFEQYDLSQFND